MGDQHGGQMTEYLLEERCSSYWTCSGSYWYSNTLYTNFLRMSKWFWICFSWIEPKHCSNASSWCVSKYHWGSSQTRWLWEPCQPWEVLQPRLQAAATVLCHPRSKVHRRDVPPWFKLHRPRDTEPFWLGPGAVAETSGECSERVKFQEMS